MGILIKGLGTGQGAAKGILKKVHDEKSALSVKETDIVFSSNLTPRLAAISKKAAGFVLESSEADHTIVYLRESWKPCIIVKSISGLKQGNKASVDSYSGNVFSGFRDLENMPIRDFSGKTNTKIYLQLSVPDIAEKASKLNSSGVSLLRLNVIVQQAGKHPAWFLKNKKSSELQKMLADEVEKIVEQFNPRPVWIRTMDFDSMELSSMEGGKNEVKEHNPMLGLRGISRDLKNLEILKIQFRAIKSVMLKGYRNIGILFPLVRDVSEYKQAKEIMRKCGISPHKDVKVGTIFETPSSCLQIKEFIEDGLDLAFFGYNDMVQYTLAVDRTNLQVKHLYNPKHPSVLYLLFYLLEECRKNNIETTMTFQSPLKDLLEEILSKGLSSITIQADSINEIGNIIKNIEGRK